MLKEIKSIQFEDFYSEALVTVLKNDNEFCAWFLNQCGISTYVDDSIKISYQKSLQDYSRPDITIEGKDFLLHIECKLFNPELTPAQPNQYIQHLKKSDVPNKGLVFLSFDKDLKNLRYRVEERLEEDSEDISLSFLSWEEIADELIRGKSFHPQEELNFLKYELGLLILKKDTRKRIKLSEVEKLALQSKELGELINKVFSIVKKLGNRIKNYDFDNKMLKNYIETKKISESKSMEGYFGYYLFFKSYDFYIWVGFYTAIWAKYGESPIWMELKLSGSNSNKEKEKLQEYNVEYVENTIYIPLKLKDSESEEEIINFLISQINQITAHIPLPE